MNLKLPGGSKFILVVELDETGRCSSIGVTPEVCEQSRVALAIERDRESPE